VHIAPRVSSLAPPGETLVSSTVVLEGLPDEWRLLAVESA
jgi:hypothetical protein